MSIEVNEEITTYLTLAELKALLRGYRIALAIDGTDTEEDDAARALLYKLEEPIERSRYR